MRDVLARNHEASAFAVTTLAASSVGVPPFGALALGAIGSWTGDWPDIDHPKASVTRSLEWVTYWRSHPRDKDGEYKRRKDGRLKVEVHKAPARQVHGALTKLSAAVYDRCATPADKQDKTQAFGYAFRVHRGLCHSVWFALAVSLLWFILLWPMPFLGALSGLFGTEHVATLIAEAAGCGALAHILGDGCTDFGVSPFAPLIRWPASNALEVGRFRWKIFPDAWRGRRYPRMGLYEPLRFKVNKNVEHVLIAPLCWVLAVYAVVAAFLGPLVVLTALGDLVVGLWTKLS